MTESLTADRATLIARYKTFLRDLIDRRPSGLRGKLALALGKHKSFVSQITNPAYTVPIPAGDVDTIIAICHLSVPERRRFLELYEAAHPLDGKRPLRGANAPHELRIALPAFKSEAVAREVEAMILDFATRAVRLARHAEGDETA